MRNSKYFIRNDYIENQQVLTLDEVSGEHYWNKNRLQSSRMYQYYVYRYARDLIMQRKFSSVVDVGCGPGLKLVEIAKSLPNVHFCGVDQQNAIEYCRRVHSVGDWYVDNFESPSGVMNGQRFDLVICSDVIEHLGDPDSLLVYLSALVRPGGFILISTPDRDVFRGRNVTTCPNPYHVREWAFSEFKSYVLDRGFEIVQHFHQLPVRMKLNKIWLLEVLLRALRFKGLRYNQVLLLRVP